MLYQTASGSVYEVDEANKRVRRLTGKGDPTPRVGQDGVWKEYHDINVEPLTNRLVITWAIDQAEEADEEGNYGCVFRLTATSPVVSVHKAGAVVS